MENSGLETLACQLKIEGTAYLRMGQEMLNAAKQIEILLGNGPLPESYEPLTSPLAPLIPAIVIEALTEEGPLNRHTLVERIRARTGKPATVNHLAPVLTAMKETGQVESAGAGIWRIKNPASPAPAK